MLCLSSSWMNAMREIRLQRLCRHFQLTWCEHLEDGMSLTFLRGYFIHRVAEVLEMGQQSIIGCTHQSSLGQVGV